MSLTMKKLCVNLQKAEILKDVDLEIKSGEFVSLLGPSGCGKSTLLKSIAGLLDVESGEIMMDDTSITNLAPEKRGAVIVFQDLRLFPHMTVEKNIAFAMELQNVPRDKQKRKVAELLDAVQLPGFEKRKIREMSGGQKQRVALARALAAEPKILLLDEPFSSLDENLRAEMGRLVKQLHKERNLTTIMVTHDKAEAMKFSDRIALMMDGEILQYDTPENMFYHPLSKAVADYMGQANYIKGAIKNRNFVSDVVTFETTHEEGTYELMVRPSALHLTKEGPQNYRVTEILFKGETAEVTVEKEQEKLIIWLLHKELEALSVEVGDVIGVCVEFQKGTMFEEKKA